MSPSKLPNDKWRGRRYLGVDPATGRKREATKVFSDFKAARRWELEQSARRATSASDSRITVRRLVERDRASVELGLGPASKVTFWSSVRTHVLPFLGETKIRDIGVIEVKRVHKIWLTTSAPDTVNTARVALSRIFAHAIDLGIVDSDPVKVVKGPKTQARTAPALSDQQLASLLTSIADDDFRFYVHFAARTGLRPSELAAVRPMDCDLEGRRVRVHRAAVNGGRKGEFDRTKNRRERYVPLSADLLAGLGERMQRSAADLDGFLLSSQGYGPVLHSNFINRHGWRILSPGWDFYNLRSTAIVGWIRAGVDLHVVRDWAGHATLQQTSAYARAAGSDAADGVTRWDSYISRTEERLG
ncbi:site-specific integrase [Nocardiopsis tropica]